MEDIITYPNQPFEHRHIRTRTAGQPLKRLQDRYNNEAEQVIYWRNFVTRRRRRR